MFEHLKIGDREMTHMVEMPESTRQVLTEILAQNRMILEANCLTMKLIGQPIVVIQKADDAGQGEINGKT